MNWYFLQVRWLGLARSKCNNEKAKAMLLAEMVCRTVKNLLRQQLRQKMRQLRTMAEEPYKQVILDLFNLILGVPVDKANRWWSYDIKQEILK